MKIISYLFLLILMLLGISFACLNAESVNINLYYATRSVPLSMLIVFSLGVGMLLGLFAGVAMYLKQKKNVVGLKLRLKNAEKEVENLRAIPVNDSH